MIDNVLNYLLTKEERLITLQIQDDFFSESDEITTTSQAEIHLVNANLLLTNELNVAYKIHKRLINSLITIYLKEKYLDLLLS